MHEGKDGPMSVPAPTPSPTTLVTLRVPVAMTERFDWMAKALRRPRNYVFVEALQQYLDQEEWQLRDIVQALDEAAQEEVMRNAWAVVEQVRTARAARSEAP